MKIEMLKVKDLIPYERNPRNNKDAVDVVANSIKEFGFKNPIIIDKDNVIVAGHTRLLAAKKLKIKEVPCVRADDLTDEQIKAFRIADNSTAQVAEWDFDLLKFEIEDLPEFDFADFGLEFETVEETVEKLDDKYSAEIGEVIYEPKETKHKIKDLFDMPTRFDEMIESIKNEDLKKLLKIRACWFCNFNFAKIADYYAYQATAEEQKAFEAMGLVLLDKDQLIENGFSDLMEIVDTTDDFE